MMLLPALLVMGVVLFGIYSLFNVGMSFIGVIITAFVIGLFFNVRFFSAFLIILIVGWMFK